MNGTLTPTQPQVYMRLHLGFFVISLSGIASKIAATSDSILSWRFVVFYFTSVVLQMYFMYHWQQILKYIPLSIAYIHRAVNFIWAMLWGYLIFQETLRPAMLLGSILVILGLYIMSEPQA